MTSKILCNGCKFNIDKLCTHPKNITIVLENRLETKQYIPAKKVKCEYVQPSV